MGNYLVVANLSAESPSLHTEAAEIIRADPDAVFVVVVPINTIPPLDSLLSGLDVRELRHERAWRLRRRLEALGAREVRVHLGRWQPLDEIDRELARASFDRVIISTLPRHISQWLRTDLVGKVRRRHPDVDVRRVEAPHAWYKDELPRQAAEAAARADESGRVST